VLTVKLLPKVFEETVPASQIRTAALVMAAAVWCVASCGCLVAGMGLFWSVGEASLAAVGGLVAWVTYREVSGRTDGLGIVMVPVIGPLRHVLDGPDHGISPSVIVVAVTAVFALIGGMIVRVNSPMAHDEAPK
jgi:hypothetical protein